MIYIISTNIFIIMKINAMTKTAPIITGKSRRFKAFTISFPIQFQPKINSTKTAPARREANQPDITVTTGFKAFFRAWFLIISI